MREILSAPSPYQLVHEAEGLISTVDAVNTGIVTTRRREAVARIGELHSQVAEEVETAGDDAGLRQACLAPLESLRSSVERQESVAHISQAVQEAAHAVDAALAKIDEFLQNKQEEKKGDAEPPVVVKPRKEIKPSTLVQSTYLETQEDINNFLEALRRQLEEAIANGERVQIR
jgi:nucleoid DNA-binding protein